MFRHLSRALVTLLVATCTLPALAIPAAERQMLVDLYNSTNGDGWRNNTDWKTAGDFSPAGTECKWYGVGCNASQTQVTRIELSTNKLTGTLPAKLDRLSALEAFNVSGNQFNGSLPSLTGLTTLQYFAADGARLIRADRLTGNIPSLTGLTALRHFSVEGNRLTGDIPSLTGLTALEVFNVSSNQLTGSLPSLTGLTKLRYFNAYENQLTGSIPDLTGLTALAFFSANQNQLTGDIPSLAGLTRLRHFYVSKNRLIGNIPSLTGLTALTGFAVDNNQLTGSIPSLSGLTALQYLMVNNNQLTGTPPAAPVSLRLSNQSRLCPNRLSAPSSTNDAWNKATGSKDWHRECTLAPTP